MDEIADLIAGSVLSADRAESLFEHILSGETDEAQIGAVLALLQARGVSVQELVGGARAMRRHVEPVPFTPGEDHRLVDTCGTGGAPKTFNVSTAAAIVAAAADPRIRVAKHGNRSRTGRGSAEVLAALGVNIDASPAMQAACLRDAGVCFCFAIHHHPAMRYAAGPRRSLGVPTVFNLLGPLTNPAGARRQLIGVYDRAFVPLVAEALAELGVDRAIVVHSSEGLDEIGLGGVSHAALVEQKSVSMMDIDPNQFGLTPTPWSDLVAGSVEESATVIERVIAGEPGGHRDIVLINAAAAIWTAGIAATLDEAIPLALEAIDSRKAAAVLASLRRISHASITE